MIEADNDKLQISTGLNLQTAQYLNSKHKQIAISTRQLIDTALEIGQTLNECQKNDGFVEWLKTNVSFSTQTAYKYISLFNYKNQIAGAQNLSEAYRLIETLEAQKKQSETQKAYGRVAEYRKTGAKPDGWRRGTDDKLAKEEEERDARIEAVKREALEKEEARRADEKRRLEEEAERRERIEQLNREAEELQKKSRNTDSLFGILAEKTAAEAKRAEFKEKIRLSAEGMKDPFQDAILDYLDALENDSRRVEACFNIIKICRRIAVELQAEKKQAC